MVDERAYWVWLSTVPGVGARRFLKLVEAFGSPKAVYDSAKEETGLLKNLAGEKAADNIVKSINSALLDKACSTLENPYVRIITLLCPEYPDMLKNIYDPPPVLYAGGRRLDLARGAIAVVGSRRSSDYGRQAAERLSCRLAEAGLAIISGLARGIDTHAHKGALTCDNGYTAAVLGCGIDIVYPPENRRLYERIMERGTLLSEYPLGTLPSAGNFPARNRIISGMSQGTLVVEAGLKSGALITVDYALEQGRDVYALPGNISSPFSEGTNKLLKEGAKMITSADDILEDFPLLGEKPGRDIKKTNIELDFFQNQVYNALEEGPRGFEELICITGFDPGCLNAVLTVLEIKGIIKQNPGKIFTIQWKG